MVAESAPRVAAGLLKLFIFVAPRLLVFPQILYQGEG
jgi:hypothetical protein